MSLQEFQQWFNALMNLPATFPLPSNRALVPCNSKWCEGHGAYPCQGFKFLVPPDQDLSALCNAHFYQEGR